MECRRFKNNNYTQIRALKNRFKTPAEPPRRKGNAKKRIFILKTDLVISPLQSISLHYLFKIIILCNTYPSLSVSARNQSYLNEPQQRIHNCNRARSNHEILHFHEYFPDHCVSFFNESYIDNRYQLRQPTSFLQNSLRSAGEKIRRFSSA